MALEKANEFLRITSIETLPTILMGWYIEIVNKIYVSIKKKHTEQEIAEELDRNVVKPDQTAQFLIPTTRLLEKIKLATKSEVIRLM